MPLAASLKSSSPIDITGESIRASSRRMRRPPASSTPATVAAALASNSSRTRVRVGSTSSGSRLPSSRRRSTSASWASVRQLARNSSSTPVARRGSNASRAIRRIGRSRVLAARLPSLPSTSRVRLRSLTRAGSLASTASQRGSSGTRWVTSRCWGWLAESSNSAARELARAPASLRGGLSAIAVISATELASSLAKAWRRSCTHGPIRAWTPVSSSSAIRSRRASRRRSSSGVRGSTGSSGTAASPSSDSPASPSPSAWLPSLGSSPARRRPVRRARGPTNRLRATTAVPSVLISALNAGKALAASPTSPRVTPAWGMYEYHAFAATSGFSWPILLPTLADSQ